MTPQLQPTPAKSHGGGPQTESGKAISSQNAITFGLFAVRDFIRPGEQSRYEEFAKNLEAELAPSGILETNLADEIRRAMWRLRRCAQIEESFSGMNEDPMQQEEAAKLQQSVDRARSQSHRLLHKSTAELRKLQTERIYRTESLAQGTDITDLGVSDFHKIRKNTDTMVTRQIRREKLKFDRDISAMMAAPYPPPDLRSQATISTYPQEEPLQNMPRGQESSFCKNTGHATSVASKPQPEGEFVL